MASNLLPAAATLFLLLLTLTASDMDSDLVLDIDGDPLEVGSEYYIHSAMLPQVIGRSARAYKPGKVYCPLFAIGVPGDFNGGVPVKFEPVNKTQKQIHLSSEVRINSGFSIDCDDDGLWRMKFDAVTRGFVVIASGAPDVPRAAFTIQKTYPEDYEFLKSYVVGYFPDQPPSPGSGLLSVMRDFNSPLSLLSVATDYDEAFKVVFVKSKRVRLPTFISSQTPQKQNRIDESCCCCCCSSSPKGMV